MFGIRSSLAVRLACMCIVMACRSMPCAAQENATPPRVDVESVVGLLELLIDIDPKSAAESLDVLVRGVHNGTLSEEQIAGLKSNLAPLIAPVIADPKSPLHAKALVLATSWADANAAQLARARVVDSETSIVQRNELLQALSVAGDPQLMSITKRLIASAGDSPAMAAAAIDALARGTNAEAAKPILTHYDELSDDLQAKAIEVLTSRPVWSSQLLERIGAGEIPKTVLNANQVAKLQSSGDESLRELVLKHWGRVRTERNPERERVVNEMRTLLVTAEGDPIRGREVFNKVCGQCHKIYGKGHDVGPDLTGNGRSSYEQLLSNVFDPSLVIGEAYQARTVLTVEGKVITGLLAEESDRQIVLKTQGGKVETIPIEDVEALRISQLSLMPEGLEKQLKPEELANLFSFITLMGQPEDPKSLRIPGSPSFRK